MKPNSRRFNDAINGFVIVYRKQLVKLLGKIWVRSISRSPVIVVLRCQLDLVWPVFF